MKVRIDGSRKVYSDIEPQYVALLQDLGHPVHIIREEPEPAPEVQWGLREMMYPTPHHVITRTSLGTTTFFDAPPEGCPARIVQQFNSYVDPQQRAAALEAEKNRVATASVASGEGRRW
jgi:hypothetical protein